MDILKIYIKKFQEKFWNTKAVFALSCNSTHMKAKMSTVHVQKIFIMQNFIPKILQELEIIVHNLSVLKNIIFFIVELFEMGCFKK